MCVSVHTHIVLHYQLVPLNFGRPKERDSWPEMYSAWPSIHLCVHVSPRRICCVFRPRKSTTKKWEGPRFLFFFLLNPAFVQSSGTLRESACQSNLVDWLDIIIHHSSTEPSCRLKEERKKEATASFVAQCVRVYMVSCNSRGCKQTAYSSSSSFGFCFPSRSISIFHAPFANKRRTLSLSFFLSLFPYFKLKYSRSIWHTQPRHFTSHFWNEIFPLFCFCFTLFGTHEKSIEKETIIGNVTNCSVFYSF